MNSAVLIHKYQKPRQQLLALFTLIIFLVTFVHEASVHAQVVQSQSSSWTALTVPKAPGGDVVALAQAPSNPTILYTLIYAQNSGDRFFRSLDSGLTWQERHLFAGSRWLYDHLAIDPANPATIYAYGSSGILRSLDGGDTWENFYSRGDVFTVVSSNILYAGGRTDASCGIYYEKYYSLDRSDDGGQTWQSSALGCLGLLGQIAVLPSAPNFVYLSVLENNTSDKTLLKSTDGGQTWAAFALPFDGATSALMIDPDNPQKLYASGIDGILRSIDGGETWQQSSTPAMGTYQRLALSGGSLYAAVASSVQTAIYRSDDDGASWWQSMSLLPAGMSALLPDPAHAGHLWAGLIDHGVYLTQDGGSSWVERNEGILTSIKFSTLAVSPSDSNVFYAAASYPYAGVYRSNDGGQTWGTRMPGFENTDLIFRQGFRAISSVAPQASNGINTTILNIHKLVVHPLNPDIAWAATSDGVYETADGMHWKLVSRSMDAVDLTVSAADPDHPVAVLVDRQQTYAYRSYLTYRVSDSSTSKTQWVFNPNPENYLQLINTIILDPRVPKRLLSGGLVASPDTPGGLAAAIYQTLDYGSTWTLLSQMNINLGISGLTFAPQNPHFMLALFEDSSPLDTWLFRSQDGGASWKDWSTGGWRLYGKKVSLAIDDLGTVYAGNGFGVFRRLPNQAAWEPYWVDDLGILEIQALVYIPGPALKLLAATDNALWRLDLPPIQHIWLPIMQGSTP